MTQQSDSGEHPHPTLLERFMRNEAEPAERRRVVRHLIAGCSRCIAVTSRLWALADPPGELPDAFAAEPPNPATPEHQERPASPEDRPLGVLRPGRPRSPRESRHLAPLPPLSPLSRVAPAAGDLPQRLADAGRRIEQEREQAPPLAAELLAGPPAARAALLARPACLTPAVCEALLGRSREAAAGEPGLALQAAELALAIAERLDDGACGPTVAHGLRVRAWAHLAQARRLGDDLDGAEWALAVAESLAREMAGLATAPGIRGIRGTTCLPETPAFPGAPQDADLAGIETAAGTLPFVPAEWAELLVFKAGLFADRGDLGGAERLLGRAAELFHAGAEPQRAGRTLVQQGLIRADMGDREGGAELLRAGVDLLDPAAEPGLVAANLYRLAALLRGIALFPNTPHAANHALPALRALTEALRLVRRARTLYRALGDSAAEAHLTRLQGQIEGALGKLDEAEATLLAATAGLAEHGFGREATLAQIELALVLVQQGRAADVRRLGLDRWPLLQARDKSWEWVAAVLVFQVLATREPAHPAAVKLLGELARYLASRSPHVPLYPHDPRHRRLERVA
jgi:tetratricopeptide (TPR) repeat protein